MNLCQYAASAVSPYVKRPLANESVLKGEKLVLTNRAGGQFYALLSFAYFKVPVHMKRPER